MLFIEILQELLLTVQLTMSRALGFREELRIGGGIGPLIFVDGFGANWYRRGLSEYLKKRRMDAWLTDFGSQLKSIDEYVKKLNELIETNKIKKPIIVGYSMGGLIAVRYAQKYGWGNIGRAITIASPLKGTNMAYLGFLISKGAREMVKGSKLIKEVQEESFSEKKLVCVYGKWDEFVNPKSAYLKGAKRVRLKVGGHGRIHLTKNLESVFDKYLLV